MGTPRKSWVGEPGLMRPATPRVCDFSNLAAMYYIRDEDGLMRVVNKAGYRLDRGGNSIRRGTQKKNGIPGAPTEVQTTTKQRRARLRRRINHGAKIADRAFNQLYKPLDEWDVEELARGRPRNANGDFRGRPPEYITREVHERALERFKALIRSDMNALSPSALKSIKMVLESDELDARGKPIVPTSAKMDAAKFLLEHVVGKPKQHIESDISVRLQGILGAVMVNPQDIDQQNYALAQRGVRELPAGEEDEEEVGEDGLETNSARVGS